MPASGRSASFFGSNLGQDRRRKGQSLQVLRRASSIAHRRSSRDGGDEEDGRHGRRAGEKSPGGAPGTAGMCGAGAACGEGDRLSCVFSLSSCNVADDRRAAWGEPRRHVVAGAMFPPGGGFGSGHVTIRKTGRSGVSRAFLGPENTDGRRFLPLVLDSAKWLEYNSDKFGASSWGVG